MRATQSHKAVVSVRYLFECWEGRPSVKRGLLGEPINYFEPRARLKWTDGFQNLVVTTGRNELLDRLVKNVPANTDWYVFLKDAGTVVPGDTMASHPGWAEIVSYSEGARPMFVAGAVANGSVDNSASKATFSLNADKNIFGAGTSNDNTKGGAVGTLYGAGDFITGLITGATQANPCVITSVAHGLVTGNRIRIQNVVGMTELNDLIFTITKINDDSFSLDGVDSTLYTAYVSGGDWSKVRAGESGDTLDVTLFLSITSG